MKSSLIYSGTMLIVGALCVSGSFVNAVSALTVDDYAAQVSTSSQGEQSATEGDILWQHTVGENIESSTAVDENGNVYATGGGNLWCFSSDGELRWKTCPLDEGCRDLEQEYPYPLSNSSSPAVSPDGQSVYVTGYAGVFAFRTRDGKVLWKKTVFDNYYEFSEQEYEGQARMWKKSVSEGYPQMFATTPAISADGKRLYAGAGDNDFPTDSFFCIDAEDGSLIWEYVNPHPPQQESEDFVTEVHPEEKYVRGYLGGASLGPDGTIHIASMHGWLISLTDNGDSYTENWAYNVGAEMRMPPSMDAEGYLYVGSSSVGGYIHKVDSRTGKKAPGKWPVKTTAGEVFANIAIASDGTVYANSEDYRLWAFNPDGTVKWNNLKFEHWGGDPLIRADDKIIVTSQLDGAARVVCVRDDGDQGVVEWFSEPITEELAFNETNVNIGPNGDLYVTSGVSSPHALFAMKGNGYGLSTTSPWPKYMGNIQNNGREPTIPAADVAKEGDILWQKDNLGENLESGPAIDSAGNVYVIGDGTVYSYTSGGSSRWSTRISGGDADTPCVSPDNSVVYASGTAGVYALNASNGSQVWHSPLGQFHTVPCVSADSSRVYIGSEDLGGSGTIYALNASDGSTAWSYHPNGADGFMGGAALDVDGNIYMPGQDGILYSLKDNGSSYSVNWTFDLGSEARQPVTVGGDGYVYATCNTGVVHKINIGTGTEDTSGSWPALGGVGEVFASMCFAADGTLYVNAEDYRLHALNSDGSEKWSYKFERWGSDPLVRDDGMIIVMGQINGAGRVCALRDDGNSASLEWTSPRILANLTLNETNVNIGPDGTIYVHSGDQPPLGLFAVKGNGHGLSTTSPWPKYMGNIENNGLAQDASMKDAAAFDHVSLTYTP